MLSYKQIMPKARHMRHDGISIGQAASLRHSLCQIGTTTIYYNAEKCHLSIPQIVYIHRILPVPNRLLSCAMSHATNHLAVTSTLDQAAILFLSRLFHTYVAAWRNAEEIQKEREEEQASLYRYKTQTHGDAHTEEERDQAEIEQQFPSFEQVCE